MNSQHLTDATLVSCVLFRNLPEAELRLIGRFCTVEMLRRKESLSNERDGEQLMYVVRKGFIKVMQRLTNGVEVMVELVGSGELYGRFSDEVLTTTLSSPLSYAQAIEDTSIITIKQSEFEQILVRAPYFQRKVMSVLDERLIRMRERLTDIAFRTVEVRLCALLLRQSFLYGEPASDLIRIPTKLNHSEIGNLIGVTRQTITSTLNSLRKKNLLEFDRKEYRLINVEGMRKLASL